jgi:hypothetical protein
MINPGTNIPGGSQLRLQPVLLPDMLPHSEEQKSIHSCLLPKSLGDGGQLGDGDGDGEVVGTGGGVGAEGVSGGDGE